MQRIFFRWENPTLNEPLWSREWPFYWFVLLPTIDIEVFRFTLRNQSQFIYNGYDVYRHLQQYFSYIVAEETGVPGENH